jgi:hypothetical protein
MLEKYQYNICCEVCGKKTVADTVEGQWYASLPSGWFYTHIYPPGDDGVVFCCSEECVKKFNSRNTKLLEVSRKVLDKMGTKKVHQNSDYGFTYKEEKDFWNTLKTASESMNKVLDGEVPEHKG